MGTSFKLNGVPDLIARMNALGAEMSTKAGQSATRAGAVVLANAVKQNAPVGDDDTSRTYTVKGGTETRTADYGHLRDNIRVRKTRARKEHVVASRVSTGNAFWARFLEFGTEKMGARPFMKPALDGAAGAAVQAMLTALNKALTRLAKRAGKL